MLHESTQSLLHELHLAPPMLGPRCTSVRVAPASEVPRRSGDPIALGCPLFAYDLPWHLLSPGIAAGLAHELTQTRVVTSLLDLDVLADRPSDLVMCPYRPERYGVTNDDLAKATFVDLRLTSEVGDGSVYTMDQLRRWDHRADSLPDETVITGARWPADVASPKKLGRKIAQLRTLAANAAIFVAVSPFHLEADLPHLIRAAPDGIVLRFDLDPTSPTTGNIIASRTAMCHQMIHSESSQPMALWVAAPTTSPLDLVKLLALGASAVSIDHLVLRNWPQGNLNTASARPLDEFSLTASMDAAVEQTAPALQYIAPQINELLSEALTFVHGLGVAHYTQLTASMLATTNQSLAKMTKAQWIGL